MWYDIISRLRNQEVFDYNGLAFTKTWGATIYITHVKLKNKSEVKWKICKVNREVVLLNKETKLFDIYEENGNVEKGNEEKILFDTYEEAMECYKVYHVVHHVFENQ